MNANRCTRKVLVALTALASLTAGVAVAADGPVRGPAPTAEQAFATQMAAEAYWTPEMMTSAIPREAFSSTYQAARPAGTKALQSSTALVPGFGPGATPAMAQRDRKSTRLNSSHSS